MISLSAVSSSGGASSYYTQDNYYTADEEVGTSAWEGEGAKALELEGPVDAKTFEAVLAGTLPDGSVIDAKRGEHRPGTDLTFSASKSVSLLALVGGDKRIVQAFRESVSATLKWAEKNIAETRTWDGKGQKTGKSRNLVVATFLHDVNRNGEPQLHVHAVIANATLGPDGKWRALKNDELYNRQHVLGTVHNADLRARVEALGYETVPARNSIDGQFEIKGVTREVIKAFSTRSDEIAAALKAGDRGSPREREIAALATRSAKAPELSHEAKHDAWSTLARSISFDPGAIIERSLTRAMSGDTIWSRAFASVRGAGQQGMAIAAAMGLTPRDGDPLVPERLGRLDPQAYAAAQAVASASRDLSEREAAFDRFDLIRAALERGGPVQVADVEARIALLEGKGLLIGDGDKLVTTALAVTTERLMLAASRQGIGQGVRLADPIESGPRVQTAARELGLRRLTPNQENAAKLLLSSEDRVVAVQGVAGAGKSAVLAPVATIARAQGHAVIGLAIAGVVVRDLKDKAGLDASTVAGFIGRYGPVVDGTASPKHKAVAREELRGAFVMVDESSMVGTDQMSRLIAIANTLQVGRLALIGDTRQLGAVEAGKPFAELQHDGTATAHIPENLRARSELMKDTAAALNAGDLSRAFEVLAPVTLEVSKGDVPSTAVGLWIDLPTREREQTILLASGRAMRAAANAEAQASLKDAGELGSKSVTLDVLDRVNATKEGARNTNAYRQGYVVEWRTNLPRQGFARGDIGTVTGTEGGKVSVLMRDGRTRLFEPGRLPANLKHDAVTISAIKEIELHEGDRIRLTETDKARDVNNADLARVEAVGAEGITIAMLADGIIHELPRGDRLLERLDLAYALNAHIAQGITAEHGIVMMSAAERKLSSAQAFLVNMTRIVDKATLVVDSGRQLERAVSRNSGEKTSALDVAGRASPVRDGSEREWRSVGGITYAHLEATFSTREDRAEAKQMLDREAADRKWAASLPADMVKLDPPMKLRELELQITMAREDKSMDFSL